VLSEEDARAIENAVLGKGRLLKIDAVDGSIARAMCNAAYMLGFERGKTDAYLSKQDWIRVEDALPEPGMPVIAYVPHYGGHTNSRRIRAQYAAKHSLEQHADAEGGDYDEVSDTYYCEPGWYEDNEYEEIHWRVSDEVTHWQPLPQPPEGSK